MFSKKKWANLILGLSTAACFASAPFTEGSLCASGLFHLSFAASVGGFADWFAVSSLFGKPFHIPWRTNLIVRRRDEIEKMLIDMLSNEMLTEERLREFLGECTPSDWILQWLENQQNELELLIARSLLSFFTSDAVGELKSLIMREGKRWVKEKDWAFLLATALKENQGALFQNLMTHVLVPAMLYLFDEEKMKEEIKELSSRFWDSYERGHLFRKALHHLGDSHDEKVKNAMEKESLRWLHELQNPESAVFKAVENQYNRWLDDFLKDKKKRERVNAWLDEKISRWLGEKGASLAGSYWEQHKEKMVFSLVSYGLGSLKDDLRKEKNKTDFDAWARNKLASLAPVFHEKIKGFVSAALAPYDGKALADMAKEKVEGNISVIRINGSLFGGVLGLLFFAFSTLGGVR